MCFGINATLDRSRGHVGKRRKLVDEGNGERPASFSIAGIFFFVNAILGPVFF